MAKRLSWAVRIERAEKRGKFTEFEHDLANKDWRTCAVGEKHNWPSSLSWGGPDYVGVSDPALSTSEYGLGTAFGNAVCDDDIPEAKRLYAEIMALP